MEKIQIVATNTNKKPLRPKKVTPSGIGSQNIHGGEYNIPIFSDQRKRGRHSRVGEPSIEQRREIRSKTIIFEQKFEAINDKSCEPKYLKSIINSSNNLFDCIGTFAANISNNKGTQILWRTFSSEIVSVVLIISILDL